MIGLGHVSSVGEPAWMAGVAERIRRIEAEPLPPNIPTLLEEAAKEFPDGVAIHIIATGEALTYAALREKVARLANGLLAQGVSAMVMSP